MLSIENLVKYLPAFSVSGQPDPYGYAGASAGAPTGLKYPTIPQASATATNQNDASTSASQNNGSSWQPQGTQFAAAAAGYNQISPSETPGNFIHFNLNSLKIHDVRV